MGWRTTRSGKRTYFGEDGKPAAAPPALGWRLRLRMAQDAASFDRLRMRELEAEIEVWKASCAELRARAETASFDRLRMRTERDQARKALELMEAGVLMEKGALLVRRAQGCCCGAPVRKAVSAREAGRRKRRSAG